MESHTGEYISQVFTDMLAAWEVPTDKIHLVLRDNGANMIKAIRDTSLPSFGCFAHTLQLVVHDGILSQRAVTDVLAICRRIVEHFKHSSVAYCRLREIQQSLGLAQQHRLKQDQTTRWNSTFYMLQTIVEQKMALAAYAAQFPIPVLSAYQLALATKVVAALGLIEEVTRSVSSDTASISVVIPFLRMLTKSLEKHHDDQGVQTMKLEMLHSLKRRFCDVETMKH